MRLKRVFVEELFGIYKYNLKLIDLSESHVTIVDAPNGMGKTTILKLIQASINADIVYLDSVPFKLFGLEFDSGDIIRVKKEDVYGSVLGTNLIKLRNEMIHGRRTNSENNNEMESVNIWYEINGRRWPVILQKDFVQMCIRRYSPGMLREREMRGEVSLESFLMRDRYTSDDVFNLSELLNELDLFRNEGNIYFIKTNRLFRTGEEVGIREDRYERRRDRSEITVSAVEWYSNKIKEKILAAGKEFADKSEELDRTFPKRVLDTIFLKGKGSDDETGIMDQDTIESKLQQLEMQRTELRELDLIAGVGESVLQIPKGKHLSKDTKVFLTNYIEDNIAKLEIYKELSEKLKILRRIINDRNIFSDKIMYFSSTEGIIFESSNGRRISVDKLSSGEKNNLILFYELIFECGRNSLILVDEPEISLHVSWQRQFIDELNEICELKNLQSIVATHSPDIVGNNVGFMIDLEDESNG